MIGRYPRYRELWDMFRGAGQDAMRAARMFQAQDFTDLQVLSQLAWFDEFFLEQPEVAALVKKERKFSRDRPGVRDRQAARDHGCGPARVCGGGPARRDRDLDLALLPSHPAAGVRHRPGRSLASRTAPAAAVLTAIRRTRASNCSAASTCTSACSARGRSGCGPRRAASPSRCSTSRASPASLDGHRRRRARPHPRL